MSCQSITIPRVPATVTARPVDGALRVDVSCLGPSQTLMVATKDEGSIWNPSDSTAAYTLVLAVVTLLVVCVSLFIANRDRSDRKKERDESGKREA